MAAFEAFAKTKKNMQSQFWGFELLVYFHVSWYQPIFSVKAITSERGFVVLFHRPILVMSQFSPPRSPDVNLWLGTSDYTFWQSFSEEERFFHFSEPKTVIFYWLCKCTTSYPPMKFILSNVWLLMLFVACKLVERLIDLMLRSIISIPFVPQN